MDIHGKINRKELLGSPKNFDVKLGESPQSLISLYERTGLLPSCITIGGGGQGKARTGYYPPVILEMIRDIQHFQEFHKFPGIRKIFDEKYRRVFELMDVVEIFRLRYLDRLLLKTYLDGSGLTRPQKRIILELSRADLSYKEIKKAMLELLGRLNIKSEVSG